METPGKKTILLVAEAVTLAHFGRVVTLAKALDPAVYHIVVASDPRYLALEQPFPFTFHSINSIPGEDFARALARGKAVYDAATLQGYIEADLALLDRVKPDLVVGDFRLSLAVSAPLRHIPYAAVINAYWSPYADISYPVPDLPVTRLFGITLGQQLFNAVRPLAFALHARPLNRMRRRYGLDSLGHDLRTAYTWADYTLYTDIPAAVPLRGQPASHRHLGPVLWSTKTALPDWWDEVPEDLPVVFVTLGSSGQADLLPRILAVLEQFPVAVMAATAGRIDLEHRYRNLYTADYLPVDQAVRRAQLMISNGGSMTTYQALAAGVPVIGLASNMDQLLNMQAVTRLGAGLLLRGERTGSADLKAAVRRALEDPALAQAAGRTAESLKEYTGAERFRRIVAGILGD